MNDAQSGYLAAAQAAAASFVACSPVARVWTARQSVTTMYPCAAGTYAIDGSRTRLCHSPSSSSTARLEAARVTGGPSSSGGGPSSVSPSLQALYQLSVASKPASLM